MADKARIIYAEFVAQIEMNQYANGTVAWLIERYVKDMASPEMNPIGQSKGCTLRVIQRAPIGKKKAEDLKRPDLIEFARALRGGTAGRKKPLHRSTVGGYLSSIAVVFKHALVSWDDCAKLTIAMFEEAKAYLQKHNVVGKASRRTRRPTDDEITALLNFYNTPNKRGKKRILRMPEIIAFALKSARRMGEICRITHGDVDYENKIYWVRDCKHPTKKKGNDKKFVLWPELETIIRRQPRVTTDPNERIFPFSAKSCSASYTNAKNALGILDLHFHDYRGDAISKYLLLMPVGDVRKLVSGHDADKTVEEHYDRRDTMEITRAKYQHLMTPPTPVAAP